MEEIREKSSRSLILKTWKRCKSIGRANSKNSPCMDVSRVSGDAQCPKREKKGFFAVYVGPDKQRFVIKAEYVNHPLFQELLVEAESQYGYNSDGPLELPCGVSLFCDVLLGIEGGGSSGGDVVPRQLGCGLARSYSGYRHLNSPKMIVGK